MQDEKNECLKKLKEEMTSMWRRKQGLDKVPITEGLTRLEALALQQIWTVTKTDPEKKGIYVSDLAKRMRVMPPSASRTLKTLEERGLVYREADPESRRNTCISLTEKGEEVRAKCMEAIGALMERVIDRMGKEDMEKLIELGNRLSGLVEEEINLMKKSEK